MALQFLHTTKSAYFYRKKKRITQAAINALFDAILAKHPGAVEVHPRILKRRRNVNGTSVASSFLVFEFESEPTFLRGSGRNDNRHGFILLVEIGTHLAVFKRHASSPDKLLDDYVEAIPYGVLSKLFMSSTAEYEKLSVKNMAVSDHAVRAASFEARNLVESLPFLQTHRSILHSVRVQSDGEIHAITPGTARVAKTDPRSPLNSLLEWAIDVVDEIAAFANPTGFIDKFARPFGLSDLPANVHPNGILFVTETLEEDIGDGGANLACNTNNGMVEFSDAQVQALLNRCRTVMQVVQSAGNYYVVDDRGRQVGELKKNKDSFSLKSKRLDRIVIVDADGGTTRLTKYLNEHQQFIISFTQPQYAYVFRHAFEDTRLLGDIPSFLSIFDDTCNWGGIDDEKGDLSPGRADFENRSIFYLVEHQIVDTANIVFCDDLGDEWADHIACWDGADSKIGFYHSKHGDVGLAASEFHIVVSQALKNLGRLDATRGEFLHKIAGKWSDSLGATNIQRRRRGAGNANQLADEVYGVVASPNSLREIGLVTSFISKAELQVALDDLANGNTNNPRIIQILWLIASFVSACREVGARPRVFCRP